MLGTADISDAMRARTFGGAFIAMYLCYNAFLGTEMCCADAQIWNKYPNAEFSGIVRWVLQNHQTRMSIRRALQCTSEGMDQCRDIS